MGLRDSLKQFWNKLRGNNPKLLNSGYNMYYQNTASNANPTNMSFTSYDGYDVEISGINQCQEFYNSHGNTKLYSATIIKNQSGKFAGEKICFELSSDFDILQSQNLINSLVSRVYNNRETSEYSENQYRHIGMLNYNDNKTQIEMYNPKPQSLDWIEKNLNAPLRERLEAERKASKEREEEKINYIELNSKKNEINRMETLKKEKNARWNEPILQRECYFNQKKYTIYQQPDITDDKQENGFCALSNIQQISTLRHRDGSLGYLYSSDVEDYNRTDEAGNLFKVNPKVCFELPCTMQEMEMQFENGNKDVVRYLGYMLNQNNLDMKNVKRNGEQTWVGRIKQEYGNYSIDDRESVPVKKYIDDYNKNVQQYNNYGRAPQSNTQTKNYEGR